MTDDWGRAWVFGDDIDTDQLAPGAYMKRPLAELAAHCLEMTDPDFAKSVRPGDVVVVGKNFGMGSSREQAAEALCHLGVQAVLADSFAGIFYRNALNLGLPVMTFEPGERAKIEPGHTLSVDPGSGWVDIRETGDVAYCEEIPPDLLEMVRAGGLVPHLEKRFAKGAA